MEKQTLCPDFGLRLNAKGISKGLLSLPASAG